MKAFRSLVSIALLLLTGFAAAQTPPGRGCISDVALTISNGLIVPVPFAQVYLCPPGSSAAACLNTTVPIYANVSGGSPIPNPFTTDAGGNYFFCSAVGHYTIEIVGSVGVIMVPDLTVTDDWSKGGYVTGDWHVSGTVYGNVQGNVIGNLTGNASTATAAQNAGTACDPSSQFAYGVDASWNAKCHNLPTAAVPFYQTENFNGSAALQAATTFFSQRFTYTNGSNQTNVDLNSTGSEAKVVTAVASGTVGHCAAWISSGGIGDFGGACGDIASKLTNGYTILPSGLMLEWMTSSADFPSNGRLASTETWPTPFPHACFNVQTTPIFDSVITTNAQEANVWVNPGSCTTSVNIFGTVASDQTLSSNYHVMLFAIGY